MRVTAGANVILLRECRLETGSERGSVEHGRFRIAAGRFRRTRVFDNRSVVVNHAPAAILKTRERRHFRDRALGHVAADHEQFVNAVSVEIGLANDDAHEIRVDIRDELLTGEDRDPFGAEVVGVRSVTLADRDDVRSLSLSGRGKTSVGHIDDRRHDLSGFTSRREIVGAVAAGEVGPAFVLIAEVTAKDFRQHHTLRRRRNPDCIPGPVFAKIGQQLAIRLRRGALGKN